METIIIHFKPFDVNGLAAFLWQRHKGIKSILISEESTSLRIGFKEDMLAMKTLIKMMGHYKINGTNKSPKVVNIQTIKNDKL